MLWVFLAIIFLIVIVKYLLQTLIPDKPEWVKKSEDELKFKRKQ
jgi:hypothetical protein